MDNLKTNLKKLTKDELILMLLYDDTERPDSEELEKELLREKYSRRFRSVIVSSIGAILCSAAVAVLIAVFFLPVLRIYGSSMTPTLESGDIVITVKSSNFKSGDIVAFYYGNKLLVKRYIAGPGEWVEIDGDGNVSVNGKTLIEPYISEKSEGETDIKYPYQVPEGKYFVLGDHRSVSVDSRVSAIGCVADEQIVGKVTFRVWPLDAFGKIS